MKKDVLIQYNKRVTIGLELFLVIGVLALSTIRRNLPNSISQNTYNIISTSMEALIKVICFMILIKTIKAVDSKNKKRIKASAALSFGGILTKGLLLGSFLFMPTGLMLKKIDNLTIYSITEIAILGLKLILDLSLFCKRDKEENFSKKQLCIFLGTTLLVACSVLNELEKNNVIHLIDEVSFFKALTVPIIIGILTCYFLTEEKKPEAPAPLIVNINIFQVQSERKELQVS